MEKKKEEDDQEKMYNIYFKYRLIYHLKKIQIKNLNCFSKEKLGKY